MSFDELSHAQEFRENTVNTLENLKLIKAPLDWLGINDPRLDNVRGVLGRNGNEFQEPWPFLVKGSPLKALAELAVPLVTNFCIRPGVDSAQLLRARGDDIADGAVLFELQHDANITELLGPSFIEHGLVRRKRDGSRRFAGLAMPLPNFGLTCFVEEITATPPPYCESPWVTGIKWFVQGLNAEKTAALRTLTQ